MVCRTVSQQTFTASPPAASQFPISFNLAGQWRPGIRTIEVDNATALTMTVVADGAVIRTVPPYVPRFNVNTGGGWQDIQIKSNGAAIQATDTLTIIVYDQLVVPPLLPSFGPAAWGGGAVPNSLVAVNPGDGFAAWQVQQLIDLLTGVMTGQEVTIGNTIATAMRVILLGGGLVELDDALAGKKFVRCSADEFQILNAAGTAALLRMDDAGNILTNLTLGNQKDLILEDSATGKKFLVCASNELQIYAADGATLLWHLTDAGRMIVPMTGVSGQPLLNVTYLNPSAVTNLSGTGPVSNVNLTVTGLPASAVGLSVKVDYTCAGTTSFNTFSLNTPGTRNFLSILIPGFNFSATNYGNAVAACQAGATNQIQYTVEVPAGVSWSAAVELLAYAEPS